MVAKRIKEYLGKLISGCQKAYQNTSNIGKIILNVLEVIAISNFHKKPGMLLLIDFCKAFDSINHEFIYETLQFLDFGPYFIKIVKTMLNSRKMQLNDLWISNQAVQHTKRSSTRRNSFEAFKNLSALEINEGKTKVIHIGANLEDLTPKTD